MTAYDIIIKPIVTENSMELQAQRKYTFQVPVGVNKVQIATAVETVFPGVKVRDVHTMRVMGKIKRQGKFSGRRASWKKAIVTLTEESKTIEFFNS